MNRIIVEQGNFVVIRKSVILLKGITLCIYIYMYMYCLLIICFFFFLLFISLIKKLYSKVESPVLHIHVYILVRLYSIYVTLRLVK